METNTTRNVIGGSSGSTYQNVGYKIQLPEPPSIEDYKTKYLYEIDNKLYNEVGGELVEIEPTEINDEVLIEYGNDEYNRDILELNEKIRLYVYSENPTITEYRFNCKHTWKGQTIIQDYDFNARSGSSLTFTATVNDGDVFRVLLSNDKGETWYSLDSSGNVIEVAIEDIDSLGLTLNQVNTLTSNQITRFIGTSLTLRVAFYMRQNSNYADLKLDHIRFAY